MLQRKAFLYIRVSTDEQLNGYSPEIQEECLIRYCEVNNITVAGIYREDYSAKTFDRPVFQKMLAVVKKQKGIIDLLLFTRWDRFSRNAGDAYSMISQLKKMRVEPQGVEQPLDLSVPENKMMLAFYLAAPEVENDRRALNTLLGMRRAKKEGRFLGVAPKGYKNERDAQKKPILAIDERIAPLIVWVFEEVARGVHDLEKIRRMANIKGLDVRRSQFWNLVHNPVYCGKVFIAAYKDEDAYYRLGIHKPLISETLFNEAADVMSGRKRNTKVRSTKDEHLPLRGFLVCKQCGRPITGSGSKGNGGTYYYYHCQSGTLCKERFRASDAHEQFRKELYKIVTKRDVLELYLTLLEQSLKDNSADNSKKVKETEAAIEKLKQRLQNAQSLMLDAELSAAEYKDIRNKLLPEVDGLERQKLELLTDEDDYLQYVQSGGAILVNVLKHYDDGDLAVKQRIIGSIFSEKLIFDKNEYRTTEPNPVMTLISMSVKDLERLKKGKVGEFSDLSILVPRTGFEPAHPCERCDLNTVRLPISPSGHRMSP